MELATQLQLQHGIIHRIVRVVLVIVALDIQAGHRGDPVFAQEHVRVAVAGGDGAHARVVERFQAAAVDHGHIAVRPALRDVRGEVEVDVPVADEAAGEGVLALLLARQHGAEADVHDAGAHALEQAAVVARREVLTRPVDLGRGADRGFPPLHDAAGVEAPVRHVLGGGVDAAELLAEDAAAADVGDDGVAEDQLDARVGRDVVHGAADDAVAVLVRDEDGRSPPDVAREVGLAVGDVGWPAALDVVAAEDGAVGGPVVAVVREANVCALGVGEMDPSRLSHAVPCPSVDSLQHLRW